MVQDHVLEVGQDRAGQALVGLVEDFNLSVKSQGRPLGDLNRRLT